MSLDDYTFVGPIAYEGKKDCTDARCRRSVEYHDDGTFTLGPCSGYHCPYCHKPCSMMGHANCWPEKSGGIR